MSVDGATSSTGSERDRERLKRDGRILHRAGLAIFPVGAGKKPTRKWRKGGRDFTREHATQEDLREWLTDPATLGWAVFGGPLYRVLVFDAERAGMAYPQIIAVFDLLPRTCQRESPSGGKHAYIRIIDADDHEDWSWGGHSLAKVPVLNPVTGKPDGHTLLAEIRGDGQYAVATGPGRPTLPDDFTPYEMTVADYRALIATVEALHDPTVDRTFAKVTWSPTPLPGTGTGTVIGNGDTADVLRQAVLADPDLWPALLDPGWGITSADGARISLKRPEYGDGTEANESGNVQDGVLVVFSESVPWVPSGWLGKGMSVGAALSFCWFDGDFARTMAEAEAAAREFVVDGVRPAAGSAFDRWPDDLLTAVHEGRQAALDTAAALVTAVLASPGGPLEEESSEEEGDPLAHLPGERPDLRVVSGDGPTARELLMAEIQREAAKRARDFLITERAREIVEDLKAANKEAELRAAESAGENPLGWVAFDEDFWEMAPSWDFLLPGIWTRGALGTIYSGPGVGKSLLGLEWAACLASGVGVLGGDPSDPLPVLYLDHENDPLLVRQRLEAMGFGPSDDLSRLHYSLLGEWPPLDTAAGGQRLASEVVRTGAVAVIIDTTARVIEGEENTADTFHRLYRHALVPLKRLGATVLRFDHTGKDEERGERGSSAKRGDVDLSYWMTCSADERYVGLERVKNRPHLPGDPVLMLERRTSPVLRHVPLTGSAATVAAAAVGPRAVGGMDPLVERCLSIIAVHPGCSGADVQRLLGEGGVKVARAASTQALRQIRDQGLCRVEGDGRSFRYTAFDDSDDVSGWVRTLQGHGADDGDA